MNDEYELLPHKILEDLKYDVESLKKKLSEPDTAVQDLLAEIADLKEDIKGLHNLFREALQDIKEEDSFKLLASLQNKIESVTTQNETIARGMIAISDKLEDFMKRYQPSSLPSLNAPSLAASVHSPSPPPGPSSRIAPHPLRPSGPPPFSMASPGAVPPPPSFLGKPSELKNKRSLFK